MNPNIEAASRPPVMVAQRWLSEIKRKPDVQLLNLSQAAPVAPPPAQLRQAMAEFLLERTSAHVYGPVLGLPELREQIARNWSRAYRGNISRGQVAITSGCNQAFTAAVTALAKAGDAVIIVSPWYFNHKMWLDMTGIEARVLDCGDSLIPDPTRADALFSPEVRAIVLISPNNPAGSEYPGETVRAFFELARRRGIALIVDETYRDFDSREGPPHDLFFEDDWDKTLIHLYSFSKAYRLTGHRVGALIGSSQLLAEVEKFLDTVTICPSQIGQRAALWGMRNLEQWLARERQIILDRRALMQRRFAALGGWKLLGCGAFFAYVEHPFAFSADRIARKMLEEISVLALPGTIFGPRSEGTGGFGTQKHLRLAFANIAGEQIEDFFLRLRGFAV